METKAKTYLVAILLGVLAITLWAEGQEYKSGQKTKKKTLKAKRQKRDKERDVKAWALGCAAVLTERNHDSHNLLGGCGVNKRNIKKKKGLLSGSWGINNREDLLDTLRTLDKAGHRKSFEEWGKCIESLSEEEYQKLLDNHKGNQEELQDIMIVKKYYEELGEKSLFGWDYGRYISLCRWGYVVGYISEEEAWAKIVPVAGMLQEKFDSWEDLGRNYLIGRQFWSYKMTKKNGYLYEDAYQRLFDMPSSPWNKYPWDMDLTDAETVSEPNEGGTAKQSDIR